VPDVPSQNNTLRQNSDRNCRNELVPQNGECDGVVYGVHECFSQ
jgi:hypothetical protein